MKGRYRSVYKSSVLVVLWIVCKSFIKVSGWLILLDWGLNESFAKPVQLTCGASYIVVLFMALIDKLSNSCGK